MSRYLLCKKDKDKFEETARRYKEHFEATEGISIGSFRCDLCNMAIKPGDKCFACCILPNKKNGNYVIDKPDAWARDYLIF